MPMAASLFDKFNRLDDLEVAATTAAGGARRLIEQLQKGSAEPWDWGLNRVDYRLQQLVDARRVRGAASTGCK